MINNVLLLVIFLSLNVFAQRTETEILKLLNDGSEKVWLYEGTETFMKGSDHCDEGKYFLFRSDNKVVIAECINNHWERNEESYTLRKETSVDWYITIGEEEFYLVITEIPAYDEIKLRRFDGSSKADPTQDIILKHLKDD
jgi:hypothetical protein